MSPTAPTANNAPPSIIESSTEKSTENNDNNNNDQTDYYNDDDDDDEIHHADAPLLVWDGTQYQLDYNHNYRSLFVRDGTTHTDILYDDDDDDDDYDKYGTAYDYAYGDSFNMNDLSVRLQFKKYLQTVQAIYWYHDKAPHKQAKPQALLQQKHPSKHTTMKHTHTKIQHCTCMIRYNCCF